MTHFTPGSYLSVNYIDFFIFPLGAYGNVCPIVTQALDIHQTIPASYFIWHMLRLEV